MRLVIKLNRNPTVLEGWDMRVDRLVTQRIAPHINRVSTPQSRIGYKG